MNKPLSSHIFRHTHISKLAELGVPLYVIQQRVGHNDSRITNEIYLHVTEKAMEKVIPALDKL
nr:tyrosine-type recombinase/integrase [Limosilactobacillus equigenerosi]